MFTGIIESVGKVAGIDRMGDAVRLTVSAGKIAEDVQIGDSVAISGVCLTVTSAHGPLITFDAVHETMRRTTLGVLQVGDGVNLERAVRVNGRLGGHIVQGHVDGPGRIASIRPDGYAWIVYIDAAPELMRYIVSKGSVAVDGISLTVAESADRTFSLSIIPYTWDQTTLHEKRAGDLVNVECDVIGKYVEKMLGGYIAGGGDPVPAGRTAGRGVTMDLLTRSGYVVATDTADPEAGSRW